MGKGSKKLYWAGIGAAFLFILLLAAAVIVPKVVDSDWLKETIRAEVTKQLKGDFNFRKAELSILPAPTVSLQQVSFDIPDLARVSLDTLKVYPGILPLFTGKLTLEKIVIDRPDFSLPLPEMQPAKKKKISSLSMALDEGFTKLAGVSSTLQGFEAEIHKGTLRLYKGNTQQLLVKNIKGSFVIRDKDLSGKINCTSNVWANMALEAELAPGSRTGKAKILIEQFNGKILADNLLHEKSSLIDELITSLTADLSFKPSTAPPADEGGTAALSILLTADVSSGQAKLKHVPYNIIVDQGRVVYDGLQAELTGYKGKVGRSTFANYSARLMFKDEPSIEITSGSFHLLLDEIFPWLASYEKLADDLQDIQKITGMADLTVNSIKGPILEPSRQHYDLQCSLKNIILDTAKLPGPLKIKTGQAAILPDRITFEDLQAQLLDSSLTYSGVLQGFISAKTIAEFIVTDAEIGAQLNGWIVKQFNTPEEYIFRTPLLVSRAHAKWTPDRQFALQGDYAIKNGPIFSVDLLLNPDELILNNLALKNGEDEAVIRFHLHKRKLGAAFRGSLAKTTIDKILLHNDAFSGAWIKGDITLNINMDSPAESVASGNLDGSGFIIPMGLKQPLLLQDFSLTAADKTLSLHAAKVVFADNDYAINGQAAFADRRMSLALDARTGKVELASILGAFKENDEPQQAAKEPSAYQDLDIAIDGRINLNADSLTYNSYIWQPFNSGITFKNDSLSIEVFEAELCSITTPGKVSFHDGQIFLDFKMAAEGEEFRDVLVCLEGGKQQMTGLLDLHATIRGQGTKDTLLNSLSGNLEYSSEDGYIYQDAQLAKLLYVLNVTNLFKGKIPDLSTRGFHYDSLIVKGTMENGIITITPARLDAPIMEISAHGTIDVAREKVDIKVLVAPLQTINRLQKMLPIISKIVPESLVAVPVEVEGDFDDIKVRTMSMSAISKSVFGTMVDALSTPVRVLEGEPQK